MARFGAKEGDDLRLVPLFPIGPFTPTSHCPHHGPLRKGSEFCCMVCSQSAIGDGRPSGAET
jgi:hypothetical protein